MAHKSTWRSFDAGVEFNAMKDINMTPLIDVMLVLLVVFMLTAPLLTSGIQIKLPKGDITSQPVSSKVIIDVELDKDANWYLESEKISTQELFAKIRTLAEQDENTQIRLKADQGATYGTVMHLMVEAKKLGIAHVALLTERDPQPQ